MKIDPPGCIALQVRLQPDLPTIRSGSVINIMLTVLLLLLTLGGRAEVIFWPPTTRMLPASRGPQLFSINVSPSSSMIASQVYGHAMLNSVNSNDRISPSSTCTVCVVSRFVGNWPG